MLDKGQPRAAAEALLANYRRDPKGERAQDSLFYLGQALMKLGQPGQACKAYAELEEVYSSSVRSPIKSALPGAKAEAGSQESFGKREQVRLHPVARHAVYLRMR